MPVIEISSREDGQARLRRLFGQTLKFENEYLELLSVLCNWDKNGAFEHSLTEISAAIWKAYNAEQMTKSPNRFTQSIIKVATEYGFAIQSNVVFTGPLAPNAFGDRVKNGVLWKDSFALDHGEFSHSYQWLSAGHANKWKTSTAAIYSSIAGVMSVEPIFHIQNGALVLGLTPLWEWLVDCTLYKKEFDNKVQDAVETYFNTQLGRWCAGQPTHKFFVNGFIGKYAGEFKNRRNEGSTLESAIKGQLASDIGEFKKALEDRYADCSALSGNTYRSANNVTYLVRRNKNWFINLYERHRTGFRDLSGKDPKDGGIENPPISKLESAQQKGQSKLIGAFGAEISKKKKDDLLRGRRPQGMAPVQRTSPGSGRVTNFPSAHPLEGIKRERMEHYETSGKGWDSPAQFVYEKKIASSNPVDKEQRDVTYHNVQGTVSAKLPLDAISLLK